MTKFTFAIMGATGHIGHHLTEELLKKGHKVRALARDMHKLEELKAKGAEVYPGESTDSAFLAHAFEGCRAVFSFLPPDYDAADMDVHREEIGKAIALAIVKAKVTHVINLSSVGADLPSGTGPIKALHLQEQRLNTIEHLNVLHFRANFFMENLLWSLPTIKSSGFVATHLKKDLPIAMVATHDIGLKIAELFDSLRFTGSTVFDFAGPRDVTMEEVTKVIGAAIGRPDLKYAQFSYNQTEKEIIASGMKHQLAKMFVDMHQAFNERKIVPTQQLTAAHRGKTTIEEFANTFAQIYRSSKKVA
jgi:uncharacterized protein YbjT (DUF2867 family)